MKHSTRTAGWALSALLTTTLLMAQMPTEPGEHHRHLDHLVGNFTYAMKLWPAPGAEPMEMTGTLTGKWVLDGRFVESIYQGEFMGMPFQGRGLDGYDTTAKKYVSSWADSMNTALTLFDGTCASDGKVRTVSAQVTDPTSGITFTNRGVATVESADRFKYESFLISADGKEFKNMVLIATRR